MPVRHPGRWIVALILLVLGAQFVHMLVTNPHFQWDRVKYWWNWETILSGIVRTLELTVLGMVIGIAGGIVLAVMRLSKNPVASWASWLYIWFFRGTPVLIQFFFWYNLTLLVGQTVTLGIPFGPALVHFDTNELLTPFGAAVIALGLNEAAYMSEIVRAGILSVDEGQTEAAVSLGMRRVLVMWRIVLPQAMRVVIPPTGNETISMLKTTSLAFSIGLAELFGTAENIGTNHSEIIPLLIVASLWYLLFTTILSIGQFYLERHFARGSVRQLPPTPWQRLRAADFSLFRQKHYTVVRTATPDALLRPDVNRPETDLPDTDRREQGGDS